jgi:hypothetical protein
MARTAQPAPKIAPALAAHNASTISAKLPKALAEMGIAKAPKIVQIAPPIVPAQAGKTAMQAFVKPQILAEMALATMAKTALLAPPIVPAPLDKPAKTTLAKRSKAAEIAPATMARIAPLVLKIAPAPLVRSAKQASAKPPHPMAAIPKPPQRTITTSLALPPNNSNPAMSKAKTV